MFSVPPPLVRRKRRPFPKPKFPPPTPPGPVLVSALFVKDDLAVFLQFDRAIDIKDLQSSYISVNDPSSATVYSGNGSYYLENPTTVHLEVAPTGPGTGGDETLSATPANGIVAVDDGEPWAGVSNLLLPFPTP